MPGKKGKFSVVFYSLYENTIASVCFKPWMHIVRCYNQ